MILNKTTYTNISLSIKILFLSFIFISLPQGCTIKEGVPSADKNKMLSRAKEAYLISSGKHARPSVYNLNTALLLPDWNKKGFVVNSKGDNVLGVLAAQTDTSYTELNFIFRDERVVMYIKDFTKNDNSLAIYSDIGEYIEKGSYNLNTKLYLKYATKASLSTISRTLDGEYDGSTWLPEVTVTYTPEPTLPPPASPTNTIPAPPVSYDPSTALPPAGTGGPGGNSTTAPATPTTGYVPVADTNPPAKIKAPKGAPDNAPIGTVYESDGTSFIWDGNDWAQPIRKVPMKGSTPPPPNPKNGEVFADYDPATKTVNLFRYWINIGNTPVNSWTVTYELLLVDINVDDIKDPSLKNIIKNIGNTKFKNYITKLFNQTFVSHGNQINVKFVEDPNLKDHNGNPLSFGSSSDKATNTWTIKVNTTVHPNSSMEYKGWGIIHEIVHSFVELYVNNTSDNLKMDASHQIMFTNWTDQMRDALVDIFGISKTDATGLALQGMDGILMEKINGENEFKASFDNFAQQNYGISLEQARIILESYENGTKGTKGN